MRGEVQSLSHLILSPFIVSNYFSISDVHMAPLRIGVLFENNQLSDIVGIDLLGNCSTKYIQEAAEFGFGHLLPVAVDMEFLYISSTLEPTPTTPDVKIVPTHTYETAPLGLDILVIGGPLLSVRPPASLTYMAEAAKQTKVIMTTCVGALWLADSGALDGKRATTNRFAVPLAKQLHPKIDWLEQRWVVDDSGPCQFWTAGGAGSGKRLGHIIIYACRCSDPTIGIDMIATYILRNFDENLAKTACGALDFDPSVRGQFYSASLMLPEKGEA